MGRKFKERFHLPEGDDNEAERYPPKPQGSCRVQAVRSVSDWSHGVLIEHSVQNACEYAEASQEMNDTKRRISLRYSINHGSEPLHLYRLVAKEFAFVFETDPDSDRHYRKSILVR